MRIWKYKIMYYLQKVFKRLNRLTMNLKFKINKPYNAFEKVWLYNQRWMYYHTF